MKYIRWSLLLAALLMALLLTGCSALVPNEYLSVTPHTDSGSQTNDSDAIVAENYLSLKNAILTLVRAGETEGVIHAVNYDGDVAADLANAAYEVSKLDPLGAYAVDYMTHSCTQIVSYYEIRIVITFRRTAQEIAQIQAVSTQLQLQERLETAVDNYTGRLTLRLSNYREQERMIPDYVADYCAVHPDTVMEKPEISISVYPESGSVRILEINFTYTHTPEELKNREAAVEESFHAAAEYIRYRETDWDKLQLLFTYLMERFQYVSGDTTTPLYDALCAGIADDTGLSQAWQLICDKAGVACETVSGMRDGAAYHWNIVCVDGLYRHVDLRRCVLEKQQLVFWTDAEMGSYYWNADAYPACETVLVTTTPVAPSIEETVLVQPEELPQARRS